jgi:hypothetical protein
MLSYSPVTSAALFFRGSREVVTQDIVTWQVIYPEEALLLEVVSIPCHRDVISSVLPGTQDDCKVTAERIA